jgi:hypothetical protein
MRITAALLLAGLLAPALPSHAQERREIGDPVVYKTELNIRDGSAAAAQSGRRYTILIDTTGKGTFKVGNRVPYATGSFLPGPGPGVPGMPPLVNTQFQYFDVGVNIDCQVREIVGKVNLRADLDISNLIPPDKASMGSVPNPTISQIRININAIVNPGRPTVVASIDDPVTMRKFEVEATVTKVN